MKIQDLYGVNPLKKTEKQSVEDIRNRKLQKRKGSEQASNLNKSDQVEISKEAQALQRSQDEVGVSKELLAKLPNTRAHVIYEALAKVKAGLYSSDEIVQEAAAKLLDSGELNGLP